MASEIRVDTSKNASGLCTVAYTNTGAVVSGIVTANSFSGDIIGDITGAITATTGSFSGLVDVNNRLDVVGGANVDQVNVTGVSTFNGAALFGGLATQSSGDSSKLAVNGGCSNRFRYCWTVSLQACRSTRIGCNWYRPRLK